MTNTTKLFIVLCLLWLCPFVMTAFYNQPAIDDYWNANAVAQYGRWGAVTYFCHTVSGRYTSLFIMSVCNTLPQHSVWICKAWPILVLFLLFFSVYFFYASLFDDNQSKVSRVSLSLLFVVSHVAAMRSLFEDLYWMSSAVCYQLAIAMFAIAAGALIRDIRSPHWSTKLIAFIATCLLPGTVEMMLPFYILLLLILLGVAIRQKLNKTLLISCLLAVLFISFFIIESRGNLARLKDNSFYHSQSWYKALYYSVRSANYYTVTWLINPLTIIALLVVSTYKLSLPKQFVIPFTPARYLLFLASVPVMGMAMYFPLHLFESSLPFPRITSLFFFFFFQIVIVLHPALFSHHPLYAFLSRRTNRYAKPILLSLFIGLAVTNHNFLSVSKDLLTGTARQYDKESYQRYSLIRSCASDTCYVSRYTAWPVFVQSAREEPADPAYFQHMNRYFKKTILLRKE